MPAFRARKLCHHCGRNMERCFISCRGNGSSAAESHRGRERCPGGRRDRVFVEADVFQVLNRQELALAELSQERILKRNGAMSAMSRIRKKWKQKMVVALMEASAAMGIIALMAPGLVPR